MINYQEVIIVNSIGIFLMLFLINIRSKNISERTEKEYLFDIMIGLTIIGSVAEIASILLDGRIFPCCRLINYTLNTICFLSTCCVGFLWCLYVDLRIFNSNKRIKKKIRYLAIPFLLDVVLCIINLCGCNILFRISEQNVYSRGSFAMSAYLILFFYFIYSISLADRSRKKGLYIQRFPTEYYVVPCILGTVIQGLFYGITLGWTAVAIAFVFVYIQLQSMNALVDALSGLYNRRYLNNILEHMQRNPERYVYGIMIDVDDFKKINDNYGHSAGDDTIRSLGQILADSIPECGIAIRYAGDEFIILLNTDSEELVKNTILQVRCNLEKYNSSVPNRAPLSISLGYDCYNASIKNANDFLQLMDERMYIEKEKYHSPKI